MLAGLIVAGLALRLVVAYLLPGSGFAVDLSAFRFWAADLAQNGPWGFYDRPFFHDYTPGYLYVLWLLGSVVKAVGAPGAGDLIKLPAILADLVCAWLVYELIRDLGGRERRALLGAALVLFIPITWFDSVVWGQVDSVGMVFVLLALRATWRDQPEWAALWGTMALLVKPQLAIIVPVIAAVVVRRAFFGHPPDEAGLDPEPTLEGRSRLGDGPIRVVTTAFVGLATATALSAPFGL
jgi:Gpi18-like mannosyltransferase